MITCQLDQSDDSKQELYNQVREAEVSQYQIQCKVGSYQRIKKSEHEDKVILSQLSQPLIFQYLKLNV